MRKRSIWIVALGSLAALVWSKDAEADCWYENTIPPAIHCWHPFDFANWWEEPMIRAEVGSDPSDNSQWIRWTKLDSNGQAVDCDWDPLCKTSDDQYCTYNPGALVANLFVEGARNNGDEVRTLGSGNVFSCGFDLTAPICNGYEVIMWGGDDSVSYPSALHLSSACMGTIYGSSDGDLITSNRSSLVRIYAGTGDDTIYFYNQTSANQIFGDAGNDSIYLFNPGAENNPWYQSCGEGPGGPDDDADYWYGPVGPGLKPGDCEYGP